MPLNALRPRGRDSDVLRHRSATRASGTTLSLRIDPNFLDYIIDVIRFKVFTPGDYIMREGEDGDTMYFLYRGEVEVLVGPEETQIAKLGGGNILGEMALLGAGKRSATVRAVDVCDCRFLDFRAWSKVLKQFPREQAFFNKLAAERQLSNAAAKAKPGTAPNLSFQCVGKLRTSVMRARQRTLVNGSLGNASGDDVDAPLTSAPGAVGEEESAAVSGLRMPRQRTVNFAVSAFATAGISSALESGWTSFPSHLEDRTCGDAQDPEKGEDDDEEKEDEVQDQEREDRDEEERFEERRPAGLPGDVCMTDAKELGSFATVTVKTLHGFLLGAEGLAPAPSMPEAAAVPMAAGGGAALAFASTLTVAVAVVVVQAAT